MLLTRTFPEHNYRALHFNGKTVRIALDPSKPITELAYPEFYDIKVTSHCKGGCSYCVDPNTLILTTDLEWLPIKDIDIGKEIIAFDETSSRSVVRKLRKATITNKWATKKPAIRVTTEIGEIIVSEDHEFLCRDCRWRKASGLKLGSVILSCPVWLPTEINENYWIGYIQGMTAGDGTYKLEPTPNQRQIWWRIALSNTDGLDAIIKALDTLGILHHGIKPFDSGSPLTKKKMYKVELRSRKEINLIKQILSIKMFHEDGEIDHRLTAAFNAGWLAGFYDAEGTIDQKSGIIHLCQLKSNPAFKKACDMLSYFDFDIVEEDRKIRIRGGRLTALKFFGIIKPKIIDKIRLFDGEGSHYDAAKVVKLERVEAQELIDITTTTKTFFANGMAVHNCYQSSVPSAKHPAGLVTRFRAFFHGFTRNQLPFQIAFGGGEPTTHPEFVSLLETCVAMGIVPNYTTNGMWTDWDSGPALKILDATQKLCGGVAVSTHPHLERQWRAATNLYLENGIHTNLHVILGDRASIDRFAKIYDEFTGKVKYFILLPLSAQGRATEEFSDWEYFTSKISGSPKDIGFGANFFPFLVKDKNRFSVSLYEPESMSAYLDLETGKVFKSSFSTEERAVG